MTSIVVIVLLWVLNVLPLWLNIVFTLLIGLGILSKIALNIIY